MATETGPDLTVAVEAVEALMDDTCIIERDPDGEQDDVLDSVTGDLVRPSGMPLLVYSGRCKVRQVGQMSYSQEAGRAVPVKSYQAAIPLNAPAPEEGDSFRVTSSRRDPELMKLQFRVGETVAGTFSIQRKFNLESLPIERIGDYL